MTIAGRLRQSLPYCVVALGFFGISYLNNYFYWSVGTSPAMLLSATGIALAAVILVGLRVWPAIAIGNIAAGLLAGLPLFLVLGSTLAVVTQTVLAGLFLKRAGYDRNLATVEDVFLLLGVGLAFSMIGPAIRVLTYNLYNLLFGTDIATSLAVWWVGSALSVLTVTPFLTRWIYPTPLSRRTMSQQFETVAAIVVVTVCSAFLYQSTERTLSGFSVVFILWTILLWVTFRLRPRFVILSLFIMTTVSLASIILVPYHGTESLSSRVISIQIIDLLSDVIFLIIFSLEDLRRRGAAALHERAIDLENALEHIRMADKAKNEFIATLAHELRNPLATIVTSLELLEARGTNDPETHKTWHTMFQKTRVMQRLLDDLLDISRITRNQLTLQVELIDVRESLNLAIQGIRSHVAARSQILHVSLPSTPLPVMADPIRLEQIFVNLFGNASKYTPRGGSITLTAMLGGTQAVITIADTGFGIPEHMMERIFEPFVQIHRPEQKREGVGIGLALTKSLIEMHGGTIAVARRIDGPGSIFTVTLPLSERTIKPRHSTKQYTLDAVRPVRILVVDDNVDAAHSLQTLLSLKGHTVEIALNGHEAIEQVQAHPPDVVLLDIGLPDMTGHEVARRLRDGNSTLFIVALSGYGQESDRRKAYDAGFNRHLTKPASLGDIERLLREREEMENKTEGAIVTR